MSATPRPTVDQLKRAITISEQIQKLEAEIAIILGNTGASKTTRTYTQKVKSEAADPARKKRIISPEGKERIAAAQRARWAKQKKAKKA